MGNSTMDSSSDYSRDDSETEVSGISDDEGDRGTFRDDGVVDVDRVVDGQQRTHATPVWSRQITTTEFACIVGTLILIAFLALTPQLFLLAPYFLRKMPLRSEDALWQLAKVVAPFNLGVTGILWNYYRCITKDPGRVTYGWRPPAEVLQAAKRQKDEGYDSDDSNAEEERVVLRYCKVCDGFKPPRAYHCPTCKRCVRRRDHHCPWVANCVGEWNYGNFMAFLLFVDFTLAVHFVLLSMRVADWWWVRMTGAFWRSPSNAEMVWLVLNYALGIPVGLSVGAFSAWHVLNWWQGPQPGPDHVRRGDW